MNTIHAVWKNGQIVPMQPVDWPEGTPLTVEPV
jgi:predicted DNA-binding antitoxin AbrB/MazE fold protein